MAAVLWSNGKVDQAATWDDLEGKVRQDQWWDLSPDEFRGAMQKRAWRWSHTRIVTAGTSEQFFAELARAGLVEIVDENYDAKDEVQ